LLAVQNEFAINGHENRISYIVGSGHEYRVGVKAGFEVKPEDVEDVQAVVDEFIERNRWHKRQQEIVRRRDRDGEVFLRYFVQNGGLVVRFVEPGQVVTPHSVSNNPASSMGIHTAPEDVETVVGYYVDGEVVDATEIQHRKANVDFNVKRGLPLFYPVRKNLRRAEKLLRNMSVAAEIQTAIAMIRKHQAGTASTIKAWVESEADESVTSTVTGNTTYHRHYPAGTILDAAGGTEYDFPASGIDASRFVPVLQAELRAVAARLVMPEFMLSSNAQNTNYASAMTAEGPAVKMFQRLQWDMIEDDRAVVSRAIEVAITDGQLPESVQEWYSLDIEPPNVTSRDRQKEVDADVKLKEAGAMSLHTLRVKHDLDPDFEAQKRKGEAGTLAMDPFAGLEDGDKTDDE